MKKFCILLFSLIFYGCYFWSEIDYELVNNTSYDVTLVDNDIDKTEYYLKANSKITISHTNSARFSIKENSLPVIIKNFHTYSSIENLQTYELNVVNKTSSAYIIKQTNQTYGTGIFVISPNFNDKIFLYTNTLPIFNLYKDNIEYLNFTKNKNYLFIN